MLHWRLAMHAAHEQMSEFVGEGCGWGAILDEDTFQTRWDIPVHRFANRLT
jgi:hypothetical protein